MRTITLWIVLAFVAVSLFAIAFLVNNNYSGIAHDSFNCNRNVETPDNVKLHAFIRSSLQHENPVVQELPSVETVVPNNPAVIQIQSKASQLHDNWASKVLEATSAITFNKFTANFEDLHTSFWYSVEETLHSASYIVSHEKSVVNFWMSVIGEVTKSGKDCNVLDVGSNGGYFSLLSRSMNCNVLAVDPQPWCLTRLSSSAAINGYGDRISTKWTAVSDSPDLEIEVGSTKCSGLWAVKGSDWINKESSSNTKVRSLRCDDIVEEWLPTGHIALMKIDAEGSELSILRSARKLIEAKRVSHVVAELVPDRVKAISQFDEVCETLEMMYRIGYKCTRDFTGKSAKYQSLEDMKAFLSPHKSGTGGPEMWRCSLSD